jgi:signal peptidase I
MHTFLKKLSTFLVLVIAGIALFVLGSHLPTERTYTLRVVLSGSMEPAIKTGSVIATIPREEYGIGDVVSFSGRDENDTPTTHRIVSIEGDEGEELFVTKGDANDDEDLLRVSEERVLGEVFLTVPYVGYALQALASANGRALLVTMIVVFITLMIIPKGTFRTKKKETNEEL